MKAEVKKCAEYYIANVQIPVAYIHANGFELWIHDYRQSSSYRERSIAILNKYMREKLIPSFLVVDYIRNNYGH